MTSSHNMTWDPVMTSPLVMACHPIMVWQPVMTLHSVTTWQPVMSFNPVMTWQLIKNWSKRGSKTDQRNEKKLNKNDTKTDQKTIKNWSKTGQKTEQKTLTVEIVFFLFFGPHFLIKTYESLGNITHSVPKSRGPPQLPALVMTCRDVVICHHVMSRRGTPGDSVFAV